MASLQRLIFAVLLGIPSAFLVADGSAQSVPDPIARLQERWRWVHFGPESGVPSGRVLSVLESDSTSWVATEFGVAWFDGHQWRSPRALDTTLPGTIARLTPDGAGGAYGISGSRLVRVSREAVTVIDLPNLPPTDSIRFGVRLGDAGALMVAAASGLYRVQDGRTDSLPVPAGIGPSPRLLRSRSGTIWLVGREVWRWEGENWVFWFGQPASLLRESPAGGLLSSPPGVDGLWEWSAGDPRPRVVRRAGFVVAMSVAPDGNGVVVLGDNHMLASVNGTWHEVQPTPEPLDYARQIIPRDNGDLWTVGPRGLHLFRASARRWRVERIPGRDEASGFVNGIATMSDGTTWLATGDGVVVKNGDQWREIPTVLGTRLGPVTTIARDTAGAIWIGSGSSFEGAYRWDGQGWRHFGAADGLLAPRVHQIVLDRDGALWFLGIDSTLLGGPGAFRWDGRTFARWGVAEGLPSGRVYDLDVAANGTIWFGTAGGISRYRDGAWRHWPGVTAAAPMRVYTVEAAPDGGAWFGHRATNLGLGRIGSDGSPSQVDLGPDPARSEVADLAGRDSVLWFTSHGGVGLIRNGAVSFLGSQMGLDSPRLWPIVPLNDRVLLGGFGLITLSLDEARDPAPIVVAEPPVVTAGEVLLRWRSLAWWGAVPPEAIETRYRLNGAPWSEWSAARDASLYRLTSGRHRVSIEAKGLFGQVASSPTLVEFVIPPPWYRTTPVVLGFLAILAGLVFVAERTRRRTGWHRARAAQQAEFIQRVSEAMPSALFQIRMSDGRILYAGPGATELLGEPAEDLVGKVDILDLVRPESRGTVAELLRRLNAAGSGEVVECECRVGRREGRDRVVAVRSIVFSRTHDDLPETVLSVAHDVTEHHELQTQLGQAQKLETVGRLAGGVAHDFNNVLTAIAGYAELARDSIADGQAPSEELDEIARATDRARALTSQLLVFARREIAEPKVLDLNRVTSDVSGMLRRLIGENIALRLDLAPTLWPVRVDPSQLEQVLVNLTVNGRDAMPGGGLIEIATRNAPQWDGVAGAVVLLTVRDTGCGMPLSVSHRIFEPFFTTKPPGKGTGLGLSTCYGIVKGLGGKIEVDSAVGQGTTITVVLPRSPSPLEPAPEPSAAPGGGRGFEAILLVEDEAQVRDLAARALRAAGYRVVEATDGRAAMAALEGMARPPDLLVVDMIMPGLTGRELWETIRPGCPGTRVLFMSGYSEDADLLAGVANHTVPFLAKPFTLAALRDKVREVLDG